MLWSVRTLECLLFVMKALLGLRPKNLDRNAPLSSTSSFVEQSHCPYCYMEFKKIKREEGRSKKKIVSTKKADKFRYVDLPKNSKADLALLQEDTFSLWLQRHKLTTLKQNTLLENNLMSPFLTKTK